MQKNHNTIHFSANKRKNATRTTKSSTQNFTQLHLWKSPHHTTEEASPYLQISLVPWEERINPKEHRYCLIIQPLGIRACGGQFSGLEAHEIAQSTRGWDWSVDPSERLRCLSRLEELCDRICKRSFEGGEA